VSSVAVLLAPAEAEALLWAAVAATGPGAFPGELEEALGRAEAELLVALRQAVSQGHDDERPPWPCRCGRAASRCRCRPRGARGLEPPGAPLSGDAPTKEAPGP
jgi:hypothetical protein